jgi:hypothetical protein
MNQEECEVDGYTWQLGDHLPPQILGLVNYDQRLVQINVKSILWRRRLVVQTMIHELLHIAFPELSENSVIGLTDRVTRHLTQEEKNRIEDTHLKQIGVSVERG